MHFQFFPKRKFEKSHGKVPTEFQPFRLAAVTALQAVLDIVKKPIQLVQKTALPAVLDIAKNCFSINKSTKYFSATEQNITCNTTSINSQNTAYMS